MNSSYCMVITTAPDRKVAEKLAESILNNKLAACIQMADIRSFFLWEGSLLKEDEVALYIKTTEARYSDLEAYLAVCCKLLVAGCRVPHPARHVWGKGSHCTCG